MLKFKTNKISKVVVSTILMLSLILMNYSVSASNVNDEPSTTVSLVEDTEAQSEVENTNSIVVSNVIPIGEDNEVTDDVLKEVRVQEKLEKKITKKIEKEEREKYIKSIVCDPNNVSRVSNLNHEDYKYLTKGTWWEGNEQTLIALEENYGISAFFAMAVSTLESGNGKSTRAKIRNNYYGLELSRSWDGLYSNTQTWGSIVKNFYVDENRKSTSAISTKYCPPHSAYWAGFTRDRMLEYYNELIIRLQNTKN